MTCPLSRNLLAGVLVLAGTGTAWAQMVTPLAYKVKAAFLYNFTLFVDWPPAAMGAKHSKIVVGVLGDDPLTEALGTVQGKQVGDRALQVVHLDSEQEISSCHVLYLAGSERRAAPEVLRKLANRPILTVGDTAGFVEMGGMIGFIIEGETVRFEIDPARAAKAGLKLSAKLLQVARIVSSRP